MTTRRARRAALGLTVAAAIGAAGIVGIATAAKPPATRNLSASGFKLAYNTKTLSAPAGQVKLVFKNKSTFDHNVSLKGKGIKTKKGKVVNEGGTSTVSAKLAAGKYTYFCSVDGHEAAGMKGTLTVKK